MTSLPPWKVETTAPFAGGGKESLSQQQEKLAWGSPGPVGCIADPALLTVRQESP